MPSKAAGEATQVNEQLQIRIHGNAALPTLVYLPGLHGDWTLVSSFRAAVAGRVRFIEFTYPRTVTWTPADYAAAVTDALSANGIAQGWLLAESFGSLPAWELLSGAGRQPGTRPGPVAARFKVLGLVLAGGFVRHPMPWGARWMRRAGEWLPMSLYRRLLRGYACYAKFRHRNAPETLASIGEFVARRTTPDREAMRARLRLVEETDPRPIARRVSLPVYHLAGAVDPIVPPALVRPWLRQHCPGYRGAKTFWAADHNVLATATRPAAETVLRWMQMPERR